jgi:hypothetical protein
MDGGHPACCRLSRDVAARTIRGRACPSDQRHLVLRLPRMGESIKVDLRRPTFCAVHAHRRLVCGSV